VHVLLDAKGKTMSHAYVEVGDVDVAGRILRGEAGGLDENMNIGKMKKERGSVLGKGRRARGVTVTRSGQEELMADVRPLLFDSLSSPSSRVLSLWARFFSPHHFLFFSMLRILGCSAALCFWLEFLPRLSATIIGSLFLVQFL
jgi:hypothetical protein